MLKFSEKAGKIFILLLISTFQFSPATLMAAPSQYTIQEVYNDVPVDSYMAYPDDQNFIPANAFMQRADSTNMDANIQYARQGLVDQTGYAVQFGNRPAVICRQARCSRLNDRITRTYLYNTLSNMFMLNSHSKISVCEADPFNRGCLQSGITFPASVGISNALVKIPSATISQVSASTGLSQTRIALAYTMLVNGIETQCSSTVAELIIPNEDTATLSSPNFSCNLTHDGSSNVSLLLNIDYIDLDYGILGGYYSLGMQGPAQGGGTGYALMKTEFTNSGKNLQAVGMHTDAGKAAIKYTDGTWSDGAIPSFGLGSIPEGEVRVRPLETNGDLR
ncbi:MAG: hypothetical protein LBB23_01440 [Rickettsiales bacterium]|jgi:hypothetical protein|nr:hypothetical protein [Rickettsiales bacterium]